MPNEEAAGGADPVLDALNVAKQAIDDAIKAHGGTVAEENAEPEENEAPAPEAMGGGQRSMKNMLGIGK